MIMSKIGGINRFDVVVLKAPDEDKEYIKRVIGMPGDHAGESSGGRAQLLGAGKR